MKPRTASGLMLFSLVAIAGASGVCAGAAQRDPRQAQPSLAIDSLGATDSYEFYCAQCHGKTGKGDGPVGGALRVRPADLTTIAERNGGVFPRERIAAYVTGVGRPIAAHGTSEMPVWGPAFRMLDANDTRAQVRVSAIVDHVQAMQATENGAALYRANCAGCHGPSGRGGPAVTTRKAPPDLTKYSMQNGGVFPSERVAQIIEGRGVPSHLDRDMPVWGATFRRTTKDASDAAVKARIDALVRFLQSIQERPAE